MAQAARLNLRMQKEIKLLVADPPPGVSFPFLSDEGSSFSSLSSIEARLRGPEATVYCEGLFTLKIQIPERYPFQPPNVTFVTPIYHPNIDNGGRICLDILNLPPKGAWQPSLNISTVLTSIGLLLSEPNPDDGLMAEASREYKYNRKVFDEKARDWTQKFANPLTAAKDIDDSTLPNLKVEAKQPLPLSVNPQSEVSTAEILSSDKTVDETGGSRKKPRLMGGKLSLKSVTPFRKISSGNIENIAPDQVTSIATGSIKDGEEKIASTRMLSTACIHRISMKTSSSVVQEHAVACKEQQSVQGAHEKLLKENCKAVQESPVDLRTVIVSDSEESDHEADRPYRSRLSLLQKRTVCKR